MSALCVIEGTCLLVLEVEVPSLQGFAPNPVLVYLKQRYGLCLISSHNYCIRKSLQVAAAYRSKYPMESVTVACPNL
jgi:hypothetical protein